MGMPPQLRVANAEIPDFSAAHFFEKTLPGLLVERRDVARAFGGRFGFVVGEAQWVIDLDYGRVRGDALSSAVTDDDRLDAVVMCSEASFGTMMRGGKLGDARVISGDPERLASLLLVLSE